MKLYLLQVDMYDYDSKLLDANSYCNVYSSFEKAKKQGISNLEKRIKQVEEDENMTLDEMIEKEKLDYSFTITQINDLEYAENFDIDYDRLHRKEYNKLEPTHKEYELDYKGNIIRINYTYRYKNALSDAKKMITLYPEDLEEGASEKFKIGDIVKLKHELECGKGYIDDNLDRIYVVRWLPRKFKGEKYFENTYALISFYEMKNNEWGNKDLFTYEYWEKDIEKYTGVIEKDSEYDLLSRIVKGDLEIPRWGYWNDIKIGKEPLNIKTFEKATLDDCDNWGWYSATLTPKETGLKASIYPEKNRFSSGVRVHNDLPRIRIANTEIKYEDTFSVTLEENPRVIIGENKLPKEDYKEICDFIRKNLEVLIKHFEPDNEFDDDELWEALKENGAIKKKI